MKTIIERIENGEIVFNKENSEQIFIKSQQEWDLDCHEGLEIYQIIGISFEDYISILNDGFYDVISRNLKKNIVASFSNEKE